VLGHSFHYLRKDGAEICISVEHEDGGLCVAPAQVGKQLVDCVAERFFDLPEFALGNKNILAFNPDENVGLSLKIECLSCCLSFLGAVELDEEMPTQILFSHVGKG